MKLTKAMLGWLCAGVVLSAVPVLGAAEERLPWLDPSTQVARASPDPGHGFGIPKGRCRTELLGGLLGGALGGVLGSRVGRGDGTVAAAAAGSVIGYILGSAIGRSIDRLDEACVGQVLERAPDQQTVAWVDTQGDGRFEVTPTRTFREGASYCRDYAYDALVEGAIRHGTGTACRQDAGLWTAVR